MDKSSLIYKRNGHLLKAILQLTFMIIVSFNSIIIA